MILFFLARSEYFRNYFSYFCNQFKYIFHLPRVALKVIVIKVIINKNKSKKKNEIP